MINSLLTGASGFLGRHVVDYLKKYRSSEQLFTLGRRRPGAAGIEHFNCDLTHENDTAEVLDRVRPDRIYHLAGIARVADHILMPQYFSDNFLTTFSILRWVQKQNYPVSLFFSSSVHVYGNQQEVATESTPARPVTHYGFSKYLAEEALRHYAMDFSHLRVVVGRLYNCVGPGQPSGYVVPDLCRKILALPPGPDTALKIQAVKSVRRFLDVRDAACLIPQILDVPSHQRFEVYNIASPYERTVGEIAEALLKIAKRQSRVESLSTSNPFTGLKVSTEKMNKALTYSFRPFDETLNDVFEGIEREGM